MSELSITDLISVTFVVVFKILYVFFLDILSVRVDESKNDRLLATLDPKWALEFWKQFSRYIIDFL